MVLEDKYRLKTNSFLMKYKDEVLDYITVYLDYFIEAYHDEFSKKKIDYTIQRSLGVSGALKILTKLWEQNKDVPPLKETLEYYHNKLMNKIIDKL